MKKTLLLMVAALLVASARPASSEDKYECLLKNDFITRKIVSDHGVHTSLIINHLTGKEYPVTSSGFRLLLDNGKLELRSSDFTIVGSEKSATACSYDLDNKKYSVRVKMIFEIKPDEKWMRKYIEVESPSHVVNEIEVERFRLEGARVEKFDTPHESKAPWNWTGGRPLFVDGQLFMGLEYPAGYNEESGGLFQLHHYPGRQGRIISKTAVIGVSPDRINERVRDSFSEYLDSVRYRAPRRFILWNGYFHMFNSEDGPADTNNISFLKNKFESGRKAFIDVGVKPDTVLVDGGWTDPKSLMEEDRRAPERLGEIANLAKKYLDAPIGVHVITHGIRDSIDKKWLAENFDMIDDKAYCFADPRAADLEISNLLNIVGRHHPKAFKFDWGRFSCNQKGHRGHLYGERFAREAITDNQIRMLSAIHEADPDAYLYNTGWFSPWWLMYYEAVFSGEDDYNVALTGSPSFNTNDLLVSWRDSVIRRNIVEPGDPFPLDALMNHSPISWGWTRDFFKPPHGSLESFSNMILMNYLRGNGLIEMFMNVQNLSKDEREVWGAVTKWAKASDSILLADSRYLGGDPFAGKVYGYAHFTDANRGIIGLRNPAIVSTDFSFILDESIGFRNNGEKHRLRISYPYEAPLGSGYKYGDKVQLNFERGQLLVIETARADDIAAFEKEDISIPPSAGNAQGKQAQREETPLGINGKYHFSVPENTKAEMVILSTLPSFGDQKNVSIELWLNDGTAKFERIENCAGKDQPTFNFEPHDGWVIFRIPLDTGESDIRFSLTAPGAKSWSWLMTETSAAEGITLFKTGLPSIWAATTKSELKLF